MRTEFGVARTSCSCKTCVANCRTMPGCLVPADLDRMIPAGADPFKWAETNLLASPGALVWSHEVGEFRIPTLVPAKKADGSCIHLNGKRCDIHSIAPFGCAFFSCGPEPPGLAKKGMMAVYDAFRKPGPSLYRNLWAHLAYAGLVQDAPEVLRERMLREKMRTL